MVAFNQYVRVYEYEVHVLVYNTITGEIIILPKEYVDGNTITEQISISLKEYMYKHYFFNRDLPWDKFRKRYEANNRLLISLETFLACNLSCPYCYQINNSHLKARISKENLDLLFEYIVKVHQEVQFDILLLKILGGEPTLDWSPSEYLLQKVIPFCKQNNIKLNLRVDTNCTDISSLVSITGYDSILFTVPLCHKEIHDKYRHYRNGKGTYDDIIENILVLEKMPNSTVVIRHNTDSHNIIRFHDFLDDICTKGLRAPLIMPQFTTNPALGEYKNQLTYDKYVKWVSSECIDSLVEHKLNVHFAPRLLLNGKCMQWSHFSLKLFSDGKVGACAAHFFDQSNPYISDILANGLESIKTFWNATKSTDLFGDEKCSKCPSFFACSGHYKLPCIKDLNLEKCKPETNMYLNWTLYFRTLYKYIVDGKQGYFLGHNIKFID